ncbi:MAG: hypothetical protein OHK0053_21290 [Microscillaceae bacterium]
MFLKFNAYPLAWAVCMFVLNLGRLQNLPNHPVFFFIYFDKLAHGLQFLILSFLLTVGLSKQHYFLSLRFTAIRSSLVVCSVYAALLELIHLMRAKEYFEWGDLLANLIGCGLGVGLFFFIYRYNFDN